MSMTSWPNSCAWSVENGWGAFNRRVLMFKKFFIILFLFNVQGLTIFISCAYRVSQSHYQRMVYRVFQIFLILTDQPQQQRITEVHVFTLKLITSILSQTIHLHPRTAKPSIVNHRTFSIQFIHEISFLVENMNWSLSVMKAI